MEKNATSRDNELNSGPAGWLTLLRQLDAKLQERWPDYTIAQIKEVKKGESVSTKSK